MARAVPRGEATQRVQASARFRALGSSEGRARLGGGMLRRIAGEGFSTHFEGATAR